jgi:hypothetical protein
MLVEAAWAAAKAPGPLHAFFVRIRARRGHQIVAAAVARKLTVLCWHLLTKAEDYPGFPLSLETARDEPVVGIDGTITAFCALGFVAGAFHGKSPLFERRRAIRFKPFRGGEGRGQLCGLQGGDERLGYGVVDLNAADIEAVDASVLDQHFASTVIAWRRIASAIMGMQASAAMAAIGKKPCRRAPPSLTAPPPLCG